jgi:hypothetical protein
MTYLLKMKNPDLKVVFMNTGLEHEKTLEFVKNCDKAWDLNIDWIEAVVHHKKRVATTFRYVNFETACRGTYIAEQVVLKYGLFGMGYLHCTREMKLQPFKSWKKSSEMGDYLTAIGIRSDEMDRVNPDFEKENLFYPLLDMNITRSDVAEFWDSQSFKLEIPDYLGNCKACWKKSDKKLMKVARKNPNYISDLAILEEMAEKGSDKMFRGNRDTKLLIEESKSNYTLDMFEDNGLGCAGSCEVF